MCAGLLFFVACGTEDSVPVVATSTDTATKVNLDVMATETDVKTDVKIEVQKDVKVEVKPEAKPTVVPDVAPLTDDELIESYYAKLADGDLSGAFAMKYGTKTSYKEFEGWYKDVVEAKVSDMIVTHGESVSYQFTVDLKSTGDLEEKYKVTMMVRNGLLDTLSSEKIWDNTTVEAYSKVEHGITALYVKKNGVEKQVAYIDKDEELRDTKFSADKRFLIYAATGIEWWTIRVYDTVLLKEVDIIHTPVNYGFTKNGKYFYQCRSADDMNGTNYFVVYDVPQFTLRYEYERTDTMLNIEKCGGYDQNDYYSFTVGNRWSKFYESENMGYHFSSNKID